MIVFNGMVEQAKLRAEMKKLSECMEVFKRSGLDKEYRRLLCKYNDLVSKDRELDGVVYQQRRKSALALLVCFVCADLATLAADQFGEVCKEVSYGESKADNDFIKLMKSHAETSAKRWNELVCIFDDGVQNDNLGTFYAEFSEEITDKVLPLLNDEVRNVMENTEKGRRWL